MQQTRHSIKINLNTSNATIAKVIKKLIGLIPQTDFFENKLGGPGCIVQMDKTMLNFKCKSHRGRSRENKTDSLCILEYNGNIKRIFAQIIRNKKQNTLIPIICRQVASGSIIWTDEHKNYQNLRFFNNIHDTVCHKMNL
ncbi:hypothetical protein H312_00043 [Anncaliia algerae PRA339]|uniref:ISXO2-like transposase domain-containing protein n=1 Tax=Anncaliia algerae PRA339 TaxID=1288291 RepID=A0A059F5A7_9MICR|nr:hypothetical protein H312_00043 [Anncaliia algerae PRA339]